MIAPKTASVSAASTRMLPALPWRDSMNGAWGKPEQADEWRAKLAEMEDEPGPG